MNKAEMKEMACRAIDARRDQIIAIGRDLFLHPELGYKEHYAAKLVQRTLGDLGLACRSEIGITGVRAEMKGKASRVKIAVMGELDAILCHAHPHADPLTGAAHSCGHNAQVAGMLGVAMCLADTGLMQKLAGDVVFMAVPAEEYVEVGYRNSLRTQGELSFIGGKQEFIALGEFDDIDMAMMFHLSGGDIQIGLGTSSFGFMGKLIKYRQARPLPYDMTNAVALNAAILGLMGLRAQSNEYGGDDLVRIHPMITTGHDNVSIATSDIHMEAFVRGKTIEAIIDASRRVDEILQAGAEAAGVELEIMQIPGYLPRHNDQALVEIFAENAASLMGEEAITYEKSISGSSDMGDLSALMPTIHPYIGGVKGLCHASDFMIDNEELTYIKATKLMAMSIIDLLADNGARALAVKQGFRPRHTKESYLETWQKLCPRPRI